MGQDRGGQRGKNWDNCNRVNKNKIKNIKKSKLLLYINKKLRQLLASCLASPQFLFRSFYYIWSLKVSRLSLSTNGSKRYQSKVEIGWFGELKMERIWVTVAIVRVL